MERINALVIAPYAEMASHVLTLQSKYPILNLQTFVGYYQNAIAYTRAFPDQHFDVVISRGGTAILLKQLIDTPVIDLNVHSTDLIYAMQQSVTLSSDVYLVSYPHVVEEATELIRLLQLPIKTGVFNRPQDIEDAVLRAIDAGAKLIIGGAATEPFATSRGMAFQLIHSGMYCIETGLRRAIDYVQMSRKSNGPHNIHRDIVNISHNAIFLYNAAEELCMANISAREFFGRFEKADQLLASLIQKLKKHNTIQIFKEIDNKTYQIIGETLTPEGETFYMLEAHYYAIVSKSKSFLKEEDITDSTHSPLTSYTKEYIHYFELQLTPTLRNTLPVLITGPIGCQKQLFAHWIHQNRPFSGNSFIYISCGDITFKNWNQHLENIHSPLHASGYTLFFKDIDQLSLSLQRSLSSYIRDTNLTKRHQIITSSSDDLFKLTSVGEFDSQLFLQLSGVVIEIPALCQSKLHILSLMNLMIARFNIQLGTSISLSDANAIQRLESFEWPTNFSQLERVIRELMVLSDGYFIQEDTVEAILERERRQQAPQELTFQLDGTLEEIQQRIILQVLKEEQMNQSAAAKRLGIGRSTLWRKLNSAY